MPGPVEFKVGNANLLPGRRMPQVRELLGIGWRGADVRTYLLDFKNTLSTHPNFTHPTEIFLPLTELIFARSSYEVRYEMADKAARLTLGFLGPNAALAEKITPEIIDRAIQRIEVNGRYKLQDILWLISKESLDMSEKLDPYFLQRIEGLSLAPHLEAALKDKLLYLEDRAILELLSRPEVLLRLETLAKEVARLELKTPEQIKFLEKVLLGLKEMGLGEEALREATTETLRKAYILGSLRTFAQSGLMPLNDVSWLALRNVLTDPRFANSMILTKLMKLEDMRLFILGLTGMGMGAEAISSFFLHPLELPEFSAQDINKLFDRVLANGQLTNRMITGFESDSSFIIEELANYGKGPDASAIIENVATQTDPVRTTEVLIDSLNEKSVGTDTVTSLIDNIIKTRETEDEKDDIYSELTSMLERTDIPLSDRRMAAINQIFSWHPEAMGTVLSRYLELYDTYRLSSVPLVGYLSSAKGAIDRLETFILTQIEIAGNREMAKSILATLRAQAALVMSQKMSEALVLALHYTGVEEITNFNLYYSELMADQLMTIPTGSGQLFMAGFLPRNLMQLTLDLLRIGDEIKAGNLEAARQTAKAAARFADENSLRAAIVRYLPAFLGVAIDGRLTDKNSEELRLAVTTDKNDGLHLALNLVQGILKDEVYTELENILKNTSPINLPPRLAILGNILRDQHLTERENRFELARQLMEKLEKDKLWIKVLDMVETQQYEKAQSAIAAWVKAQLASA